MEGQTCTKAGQLAQEAALPAPASADCRSSFHSNLVAAYEKAKKKHQNKLKKLESQMMAMVERHDTQVRMLKQRIALLEEENSRPHTNETSL